VLLALIGYIGTMLVAFAALVAAWFVVVGPPPQRQLHQPPHAIGAVAQTTAPAPSTTPSGTPQPGTSGPSVVHRADDGTAAANADDGRAAAEQAAAEKAKQLKLARYRKRKEQEARRRQEQQDQQDAQYAQTYSPSYSLGYDRDDARDRPPPPPAFFLFGPPRY